MVSAGDFRNGLTIEFEGNVYQIIEFQHVKPGKGAAFVRTKLRNIKNGGIVEKTFRPTEKCPQAHIERSDMQYLYSDGELFYFMDVETYDQIALNEEAIGDTLKFVKENDMVKMLSHNGEVFAIEPPLFVELDSRVIHQQARQNRLPLRRARWLMYRCLLKSATKSRLIQEPENIFREYKYIPQRETLGKEVVSLCALRLDKKNMIRKRGDSYNEWIWGFCPICAE